MRPVLIPAAVCAAVALAACGGSSQTHSAALTEPATPTTSAASPTTPTTPTTATSTTTNTAAVHTATVTMTATAPTPTNTTPTPTSPSGGVAPGASTSTATSPSGGASPGVSPAIVAKAKAALQGCQANQPGITLAELEREAQTAEGIQC